jgi:hypothetical protein
MREWCGKIQERLESLYLRGKLTFGQYDELAEYALSLAIRAESGEFDWGVLDAEQQFDAMLSVKGVLL